MAKQVEPTDPYAAIPEIQPPDSIKTIVTRLNYSLRQTYDTNLSVRTRLVNGSIYVYDPISGQPQDFVSFPVWLSPRTAYLSEPPVGDWIGIQDFTSADAEGKRRAFIRPVLITKTMRFTPPKSTKSPPPYLDVKLHEETSTGLPTTYLALGEHGPDTQDVLKQGVAATHNNYPWRSLPQITET